MSYVVFFDVDGTLIRGQSQKYFVRYLYKKKIINLFFLIRIYLWFFLYKIGLKNNVVELIEKSYSLIKGLSVLDFNKMINEFYDQYIKNSFYRESLEIINSHKSKGAIIILVTSTLKEIAQKICDNLDLYGVIGTNLSKNNDIYTGGVKNVAYGHNKIELIKEFINLNSLSLKDSYAYSDHTSDLPLLGLVDHPIVVNPRKKFEKIATSHQWSILIIKE